MPDLVYISLGTNLGDRLANLKAARAALAPAVQLMACSRVYQTPPWGYLEQPAFLNQVVKGETSLLPEDLLDFLKQLEVRLGRRPAPRYGPRVIDLDILFYADLIIDTPDLSIPHPHLAERAFVLVPLADLDPSLRHPLLGTTVRELLDSVEQAGIEPYPQP